MPAEYLTAREAAAYTSLSESYLAKLRMGTSRTEGPAYILVGLRAVRYKRSALDDWMDGRAHGKQNSAVAK
ncbi:helix-turn-helix domain-containing protein [Rhodobacteraceae bacterium D3-12]|nr:helix-turn-helix domain-containing protein [Rhodobacteraceae bacterium D3-12]